MDDQVEVEKPLLTKQEAAAKQPRTPYEQGATQGTLGSIQDPKRKEFNLRWKYYSSLTLKSGMKSLDFPHHISITSDILLPAFMQAEQGQKQSSLTTIFSIWNTMIGSSLLALPWALTESGFATGIATLIVMCAFCCYTAWLIVSDSEGYDDFTDVCDKYLGKAGRWLAWVSSLLILLGAIICYHVLMSQALFSLVNGLGHFATGNPLNTPWWTSKIAAIAIFCIVFPISNVKEQRILVRFNSTGIFWVIYIIIFIVTESILDNYKNIQFSNLPQFNPKFHFMAGMLLTTYYLHNFIVPILNKQEHPEHNLRDLILGYVCAALSLIVCGVVAYICYGDVLSGYQNFLSYFTDDRQIYPLTARFALLAQVVTVMPLVLFMVRIQFWGFLWDSPWPGVFHVVGLNALLCTVSLLFAMYYPNVGDILRFTGAICGLLYVAVLPLTVHMLRMKRNGNGTVISYIFHSFLLVFAVGISVSQFISA